MTSSKRLRIPQQATLETSLKKLWRLRKVGSWIRRLKVITRSFEFVASIKAFDLSSRIADCFSLMWQEDLYGISEPVIEGDWLDVTIPPPQNAPEDNTKPSSSQQQQEPAINQTQSAPLSAWVAILAFIGIAAWLAVRYSKRSSPSGDRKEIAYQPVVWSRKFVIHMLLWFELWWNEQCIISCCKVVISIFDIPVKSNAKARLSNFFPMYTADSTSHRFYLQSTQ